MSATTSEAGDPLYPTFQKYDSNSQGFLSQYEVTEMMRSLQFSIQPEYIASLMELFSSIDDEHCIHFPEFKLLWAHLNAEEEEEQEQDGVAAADETVAAAAGQFADAEDDAEAGAAAGAESPTVAAEAPSRFAEFDLDQDGLLNNAEVQAMMVTLGYKVTDEYLASLMDLFASFDTNH
eukprot:SAG22_NODE_4204_length_1346_cov_6.376905_1_plen_177_part_10